MTKITARCMPRLLKPDQKRNRMNKPLEDLTFLEADTAGVRDRFLTQDECWNINFERETKRKSMQLKQPSSFAPKNAVVDLSDMKLTASVFHIGHYANIMMQLRKRLKTKSHGKAKKGALFQQKNARLPSLFCLYDYHLFQIGGVHKG